MGRTRAGQVGTGGTFSSRTGRNTEHRSCAAARRRRRCADAAPRTRPDTFFRRREWSRRHADARALHSARRSQRPCRAREPGDRRAGRLFDVSLPWRGATSGVTLVARVPLPRGPATLGSGGGSTARARSSLPARSGARSGSCRWQLRASCVRWPAVHPWRAVLFIPAAANGSEGLAPSNCADLTDLNRILLCLAVPLPSPQGRTSHARGPVRAPAYVVAIARAAPVTRRPRRRGETTSRTQRGGPRLSRRSPRAAAPA